MWLPVLLPLMLPCPIPSTLPTPSFYFLPLLPYVPTHLMYCSPLLFYFTPIVVLPFYTHTCLPSSLLLLLPAWFHAICMPRVTWPCCCATKALHMVLQGLLLFAAGCLCHASSFPFCPIYHRLPTHTPAFPYLLQTPSPTTPSQRSTPLLPPQGVATLIYYVASCYLLCLYHLHTLPACLHVLPRMVLFACACSLPRRLCTHDIRFNTPCRFADSARSPALVRTPVTLLCPRIAGILCLRAYIRFMYR